MQRLKERKVVLKEELGHQLSVLYGCQLVGQQIVFLQIQDHDEVGISFRSHVPKHRQ